MSQGARPTPLRVVAVLAGCCWGLTGAAQETDEIDEILVTGRSAEDTVPYDLHRYGHRLHVITSDDIEISGFDDLGQALQMEVPGLYVAPKNGAFDYVNCSLQGSRCEDVLWLIDGVRINNRLYNTTTPLDTIPAHIVERIEVLYGGQGIFYGTQSVAGVVNIVTKEFAEKSAGSLEAGLAEYDGLHVNGHFSTTSGPHQVLFYASLDRSEGHSPFSRDAWQASATDRRRSYDVVTAGASYARDFGDDSRLTMLWQRSENEVDNLLPYQVAVRNNARREDLVTAKWDGRLSDAVDVYVKAYFHEWDTEWDHVVNDLDDTGGVAGTRTVLFRDASWGFRDYGITGFAHIRTGRMFDYALGYDYQRFRGSDEVWRIEDKAETAQAVYGQVRTENLLPDTRLAFGVRHNATGDSGDATVWNLSGQRDFAAFYVRGSAGTSFRLPDAEELYLDDCCEVGNPDLAPEESRNLDVAIGGTLPLGGDVDWELTAFAREIDHLIEVDFDNPAFPDGRFENSEEKARFRGWGVSLNTELFTVLDVSFDFTVTDAEMTASGETIQDIPETVAKLAARYSPSQVPLEIKASAAAVGAVHDVVGSGIGRIDHGNYVVADLAAVWYLDEERRHRVGLRLENAFDTTYATSVARALADVDGSAYPYRNLGMPRTLHASYRYTF